MSANSLLVATAELRWFKKARKPFNAEGESVLQQYWSDPLGVSGKGVWRDVPTVTESQQGFTEPPTLEN
jgi:hypothetical protein